MPIIRKVFGPFHAEVGNPGTTIEDLRWHFIGIRDDKTTVHWTLAFDPKNRKYRVNNNTTGDNLPKRSRNALLAEGINPIVDETARPDAWLGDEPVMSGKISDILKSKLSPADIARATALTIMRK